MGGRQFLAEIVSAVGDELFDIGAEGVHLEWLETIAAVDALAKFESALLPTVDDAHALLFHFVHLEVELDFALFDDLAHLLENIVDAFDGRLDLALERQLDVAQCGRLPLKIFGGFSED